MHAFTNIYTGISISEHTKIFYWRRTEVRAYYGMGIYFS